MISRATIKVSPRDLLLPLAVSWLVWPTVRELASLDLANPDWLFPHFSFDGEIGWRAAGQFLSGLTLSLLCLAALRATIPRNRLLLGVSALILGLVSWSLLVNGLSPRHSPDDWFWQLCGIPPGLALGSVLATSGRISRPVPSGIIRIAWMALFLPVVVLILLPSIGGDRQSAQPLVAGVAAYPAEVAQRIYQMSKAMMPWLPTGLLLSLVLPVQQVKLWAICAVAGYVFSAFALPADVALGEFRDLVFTLPGLAAGLWLGDKSRVGEWVSRARVDSSLNASQASPVLKEPLSGTASKPVFGNAERSGHAGRSIAGSNETMAEKRELATVPSSHGLGTLAARIFGFALIAIVLAGLLDFPRWQLAIGLCLALYAATLWVWPLAWLVVVPAALPLMDLAPWTGRFFFDEFDLLMLVSAGMYLLKARFSQIAPTRPTFLPIAGLVLMSLIVSASIGLLPAPPLDFNAIVSYWSPYNSLRVAKGFLWGWLMFMGIRHAQADRQVFSRLFAVGMGLGLFGVGVIGAWEHHLFVGFQDRFETYRIVSTFSSMHTGGGHIEAYLVASLPFLWLATSRLKHLAVSGPLMVLTAYVMLYTVARGGVLALGVVILILLLASGRLALLADGRRFLVPVAMLIGVGLLLAVGTGGGYMQKRLGAAEQDWQTRVDHWAQAVEMMDGTFESQIFGMGLGSFPRRYLERGPADNQPATFGFSIERDNTFFRLGSGATVYYAQRVPFAAGDRYRLELDARARQEGARIDTPVCEKQLLNSRECVWMEFTVPGNGEWHRLARYFSSAEVGAQDWLHRPPVELSLYNPGKNGVVEVDNVRLLDSQGRNLLCNGDFSQGGDCWFFKTHSHLPWHIKNVWVHVLFEQGWLGLVAFASLTLLALSRLARAGWSGHRLAWVWLASLAGLLVVGMFDSLIDAPRLSTLLTMLLLLGAGFDWEPRAKIRRKRHASRSRKKTRLEDVGGATEMPVAASPPNTAN